MAHRRGSFCRSMNLLGAGCHCLRQGCLGMMQLIFAGAIASMPLGVRGALTGIRNAKVLPEPVLAAPRTSWPASVLGRAAR